MYDCVINERDMGLNLEVKNGKSEYVEKASFSLEIVKHIDAGPQSGFLCTVNCFLCNESR